MGRRKIEIKAIKDDRNRSVTFLKRKGGLFKKAHELSVLCSVDVAVFIFGNNKKLYEYSSSDMRDMISRYTYHGGPSEHKGPADFNGGNDDDDDDDENGTPPQRESVEPQMMPPQFQGHAPFPHMRQHEPSASPPINGMPFPQHPGHHVQRSHTPQPQIGSRPGSRQDFRRMSQPPAPPPQQPANGYAYMPNPAIYNSQNQHSAQHGMPPQGTQYQYPPSHPPQHPQQYMEEQRRASVPPPSYPQAPHVSRVSPSPPQPHSQPLPHPLQHQHQQPQQQHHQQPVDQVSPPPPPPQHRPLQRQAAPEAPMGAPTEPKTEHLERPPQPPLLNTDSAIKKMPARKQHSIFTPIDENRSILSQHLASFAAADPAKAEALVKAEAAGRPQPVDMAAVPRSTADSSTPPFPPQRSDAQPRSKGRGSGSTITETGVTPPSRSDSMKLGSAGGGGARPRLRVEIPDEPSDGGGSATAASESTSPRTQTEPSASQATRRPEGQASNLVLPPPSPSASASALLSAGATGPPNPFARPPPQQNNNSNPNIETPVSALPSRFMNSEFLPSPSSFDPYWSYRGGNDNNTLPSPLNFATPVAGQGPSFLRDENATTGKRKTPDPSGSGPAEGSEASGDAKRAKLEAQT